MPDPQRRAYFDSLASRWDEFTDHVRVRTALKAELQQMQLAPDEHVLDLGCGTGNLTAVLLDILGEEGHVTAVDYSSPMVERARSKFPDSRVGWHTADATSLPLPDKSCDRVICFSAWPHFPDPSAVLGEMHRVLRDNGILTILHIDSRETINHVHANASDAIRNDMLPPASHVATLMSSSHFAVERCEESSSRYIVQGRKA
jgi:ubiquinone/menaquinone biosynthesis C-methylase UbiE